jgi:small subunit ribosomal protein S17
MACAARMPAFAPARPHAAAARSAPQPLCRDVQMQAKKPMRAIIVSTKMEKTAVAQVTRFALIDTKYGKREKITKKYHIHDEENELDEGDIVIIRSGKKLSKKKNHKLVRIVQKVKKV